MKQSTIIIVALCLVIVALLVSFVPNALVKPCASCGGDGDLRCSDCKGKGSVDCENCDAKGVLYCTKCKGDKTQTCSDCSGKGYTLGGECSGCGGDGRVITSIDLSKLKDIESEWLQSLYKNAKYNTLTCWWEYDCNKCKGCGTEHIKCETCRGDGEVSCSKCDGTGGREICSICRGAKIIECPRCASEGHYDCSDCDGTGKRFIWN